MMASPSISESSSSVTLVARRLYPTLRAGTAPGTHRACIYVRGGTAVLCKTRRQAGRDGRGARHVPATMSTRPIQQPKATDAAHNKQGHTARQQREDLGAR